MGVNMCKIFFHKHGIGIDEFKLHYINEKECHGIEGEPRSYTENKDGRQD